MGWWGRGERGGGEEGRGDVQVDGLAAFGGSEGCGAEGAEGTVYGGGHWGVGG